MTGLRFLAASGVFVFHITFLDALRNGDRPHPVWFLLGSAGVSLFFVLSGFVLTHSARETDTARGFWRRRAVKIYPNHLVVLALLMLLVRGAGMPRPLGGPAPVSGLSDWANATLAHSFAPLSKLAQGGNGVAWSLTCELLFYLLFPLFLPLVLKIRPDRLPLAAVVAVAGVWAIPTISLGLGGTPLHAGYLPGDITDVQLAFVYSFPPSRLPEFVLGMILARMHTGGHVHTAGRVHPAGPAVRIGVLPSGGLLCAALLLGIALLPAPFLPAAVTVIPVGLLVRATAALDARGGRSLLRTRGMVFLGDLSYAFYLVHLIVIAALLHYWGRTWPVAGLVCASLAVALTASWMLYALVERPCMRRFATGRSPRAAVRSLRAAAPAAAPAAASSEPVVLPDPVVLPEQNGQATKRPTAGQADG
ncbi:acyltransferase [Streptomyces axinellae]|uniref:acyltransferase family protein n=1 Tax=Streptomyces axinellae TaxID=552788 RepID=UPI0031DE7349